MITQLPRRGPSFTLFPTKCRACKVEFSLKEAIKDWTCPSCCAEHAMPSPCPTCLMARPTREELIATIVVKDETIAALQDRAFYAEAYELLVAEAGASSNPLDRDTFLHIFCEEKFSGCKEYRFCGLLDFGGKFWQNFHKFYVTCYGESRTPERNAIIEKVNKALEQLVIKHNPRLA